MNYALFRKKVKKYPFFHSNIFVHLTDKTVLLRRQISDWVEKGYVIQLKRGFYTLCEEDRQVNFSQYFLANNLYRPSYVSLESALSYYHFIPERVHTVTSISSKKTQVFENPLGTFKYRHIKTELYGDFVSNKDQFGNKFLIATPERAISDFFYYQGRLLDEFDETIFDTSFRLQNLDLLNKKKLKAIANRVKQKKHSELIETLIKQLKIMNETLITKLNTFGTDQAKKYNYLREYFQLLSLKILDEYGFFRNVAFVGGTALRILYDLNRFSEDLDFCLIEKKNFSFHSMIQTLKKGLNQENFEVETTVKENKTVGSAFIKFNQLLFKLGISRHKDEKLSIKIEIDQTPPKAFHTEFTMINKEFLIGINHYDLPSLFSGKLHAVLCRAYTKGRDYYDLMWFITRKIEPNYALLSNAIEQTEKTEIKLNRKTLITLLHKRIEETDFRKIRLDIEPFLADSKEIRYFEKDFFERLVIAFPGSNENKP